MPDQLRSHVHCHMHCWLQPPRGTNLTSSSPLSQPAINFSYPSIAKILKVAARAGAVRPLHTKVVRPCTIPALPAADRREPRDRPWNVSDYYFRSGGYPLDGPSEVWAAVQPFVPY